MKIQLRMLSLILALGMALSLLTGCQSSQKAPEPPAASSSGEASQEADGEKSSADESSAEESDEYEVDGTNLVAYHGTATETTTPSDVETICSDAFSWDMGHGEELEKVRVTGNVKRIDDSAFAFTAADEIYIEEGCLSIGYGAFSDSYIEEIWFPSSITEVGANIMMTEEGLDGTKIHVVEGSVIAKYFEADMPYGDCELVYDYQ